MRTAPNGRRPAVRQAVLVALAGLREAPAPALEVARATDLSTVVVIPLLQELVEEGLVARVHRGDEDPGDGAGWCYRLTARGVRTLRVQERTSSDPQRVVS